MTANKVYIVGIGHKPLDERCRKVLSEAASILVPRRLMEVFRRYPEHAAVAGKTAVVGKVGEIITRIRENPGKETMVLLASGDPMFHGTGRLVISACGSENVEVFPDLSSVQVAFSKLGEHWDDACLVSVHAAAALAGEGRLLRPEQIPALLVRHTRVAVLTDGTNSPAEVARHLLASPFAASVTVHVFEKLGYGREERITSGRPADIAAKRFADPNVVILVRHDGAPPSPAPCFGLRETEFVHSRGLITKDEVRAVSIHALCLPDRGVLWDVGAGCGSLSVETGRLFPGLTVCAVEKEGTRARHIAGNALRLGAPNVLVVKGRAPGAFSKLPCPDRVFVGGGGKDTRGIIDTAGQRMDRGIIVVNAVTLETLHDAIDSLEKGGFAVEASQVGISRLRTLAGRRQFAPLTQVYVIKGERR